MWIFDWIFNKPPKPPKPPKEDLVSNKKVNKKDSKKVKNNE